MERNNIICTHNRNFLNRFHEHIHVHVWQFRVEINDRITAFEALYHSTSVKDGAHTHLVDLSGIDGTLLRTNPALNGNTVLERFERSNAVKIRNGIMFDSLPHVLVQWTQAMCM